MKTEFQPQINTKRQIFGRLAKNYMKTESSNLDFSKKTILVQIQLKLNENWKFDPRILLKYKFTLDSTKFK